MSTDTELEIMVPEDKKPEEVTVEPPKPPVVEPEEGITKLKSKLQLSESQRVEAEKQAYEAKITATKAKAEVSDAQYQMVKSAIKTVQTRAEQLKTAYAEALTVGDHNRAAETQQALSMAANQLSQLEQGKKAMKKQLKAAKKAAERLPPAPQHAVDMVEQLAAQVSAPSAAWLRDNRDNLPDERAVRRMFRAHEDAIDDGIKADTPEYFSFIEGRLGIRRDEEPTADNPLSSASQPKRSVPPPPAPASRAAPSRPGTVRLSADQAEMARSMGMTPEEYAKNLVALKKEGRM